jgi:hypothetical protein
MQLLEKQQLSLMALQNCFSAFLHKEWKRSQTPVATCVRRVL